MAQQRCKRERNCAGRQSALHTPRPQLWIGRTVNLLLKVQNVENEEETRDFIRLDAQTFKQQERQDPKYYVRTDLNPGKYKLLPYFVYKDTEYPMEANFRGLHH